MNKRSCVKTFASFHDWFIYVVRSGGHSKQTCIVNGQTVGFWRHGTLAGYFIVHTNCFLSSSKTVNIPLYVVTLSQSAFWWTTERRIGQTSADFVCAVKLDINLSLADWRRRRRQVGPWRRKLERPSIGSVITSCAFQTWISDNIKAYWFCTVTFPLYCVDYPIGKPHKLMCLQATAAFYVSDNSDDGVRAHLCASLLLWNIFAAPNTRVRYILCPFSSRCCSIIAGWDKV